MGTFFALISSFLCFLFVIPGATANLVINNFCPDAVHAIQDAGIADGLPSFDVEPGDSLALPIHVDPHGLGAGISVKISRASGAADGILQFEYTLDPGAALYWDLSDLDGGGAGVVASPFRDAHVRVTPTGRGAGQGVNGCWTLDCPAGQVCQESYQFPDQEATRSCPAEIGDFVLDLCL